MNETKELENIGLTKGEAKVYLALIELGSTTVGPLVKKANVAYSNIYEILNRLVDKGLVSYIVKSKTKYFQAASPKSFSDYFNKKEQELKFQNEEILFFYIHDKKYGDVADNFYFNIHDLIKSYKNRGISNEEGRKSEFNKKVKYIRYVNFPIPGNIEVGGDNLLIISWEKPVSAILIHSPSIAENFRKYFFEVWEKSKK